MSSIEEYWNMAVPFEVYVNNFQADSQLDADEEHKPFYALNKQRIERILKTYQPPETQKKTLQEKDFKGKILVISEGWCGDAAQSIPVIYQFFSPTHEVRVLHRDNNDLINSFLTNGSKSVPVVLMLKEGKAIANWGPRPAFGDEYLQKYKAHPESYTKDQFIHDLQMAYNKDKGVAIIDELLALID